MPKTRNHIVVANRFVLRSLYRKGSTWAAKIRDRDTGKVRQKTSREKTEAAARRDIVQWLEAVAKADQGEEVVPVTLKDAAEEWLSLRTCRPPTTEMYRQVIERSLVPAWGGLAVDLITLADVEGFIAARRARGNSPRTIAIHVGTLRAILKWAIRRGYAWRDPTDGIKLGTSRRIGTALSEDEARRLLEAAARISRPLWLCLLVALLTGLRRRNLFGLTWGHLDLERGAVFFPAEETKGDRPLEIPLHGDLVQALREARAGTRTLGLDAPILGRRYTVGFLRTFPRAQRDARIPQVRLHDLRHTFATWMALRCSHAVLQALLGHAPQGVTSRYLHAPWGAKVEAIGKLPRLLRAPGADALDGLELFGTSC